MIVYAWIAILGAAAVVALYFVKRLRAAKQGEGRPVLLGEMMQRHGVGMEKVIERGFEDELPMRARLCEECTDHETCTRRMQEAEAPDYCDICPNAEFIDGLKAQS